ITARLDSLPPESVELMYTAAVLGRDFEVDALAAVAHKSTSEVLPTLEPVEASGMVVLLQPGRFRFKHALYREVPYASLGSVRRLALHRHAAEYLESRYADDPNSHLTEIAYHCFQSLQSGLHDTA